MLVLPQHGEGDLLAYAVNKAAPQDLVLRLFTNDLTPGNTDTAASYTEASGNGYAAVTLTGANWTVTEGTTSEAAYPEQVFTFTGALGNVYGYFLTRAISGKLAWAERFTDGPYGIVNNGDQIKVNPKFTLS